MHRITCSCKYIIIYILSFNIVFKAMVTLVLNLVITDLFNGSVAIPCFIIPHYWLVKSKQNRYVCILSYMVPQYSVGASLLTTTSIAIERYVAIVHPFAEAPRGCRGKGRTVAILMFIWLYPAIVFSAVAFPWTHGKTWPECEMSVVLSRYHYAVMGGHIFIALILATTLYAKIMRKVRRSKSSVQRFTVAEQHLEATVGNESNRGGGSSGGDGGGNGGGAVSDHDVRVVKTLALLMAIFYICFLPLVTRIVIHASLGMPAPEPLWLNLADQVMPGFCWCIFQPSALFLFQN